MVQSIIKAGYAYRAEDGSVYFSMDQVKDYGQLSGMKIDEMMAGTRVESDESKRNPADFALWKSAKPGEISWHSPWGDGRPGWHIECSAMCREMFGETLDIHGGGNDLIFPHHENEILQSWAVTGKKLANYWLHNGMLEVQEAKMSKSLKNFFTVRQVLEAHSKEEIRFYFLNTHYRGPIGYSDAALHEAAASLKRLHNTYAALATVKSSSSGTDDVVELVEKARADFIDNMDDDFNSRAAIAVIFELVREVNRLLAEGKLSAAGAKRVRVLPGRDGPGAGHPPFSFQRGAGPGRHHPDHDRGPEGAAQAQGLRPGRHDKGPAGGAGNPTRGLCRGRQMEEGLRQIAAKKAKLLTGGAVRLSSKVRLPFAPSRSTAGPGAGTVGIVIAFRRHRVKKTITQDKGDFELVETPKGYALTHHGQPFLETVEVQPTLFHAPEQAFFNIETECIYDCKFCTSRHLEKKITKDLTGEPTRRR